MAKHRLNSLSQNSHQGISNTWEKHTEGTVHEKSFPSAKHFHQWEVSSKGPLDFPSRLQQQRPSAGEGEGQREDGSPGRQYKPLVRSSQDRTPGQGRAQ